MAVCPLVIERRRLWAAQRPGVRVVHLLPTANSSDPAVSLTLQPWVLPNAIRYSLRVIQPNAPGDDRMTVSREPNSSLPIKLKLRYPGVWAVVEIQATEP